MSKGNVKIPVSDFISEKKLSKIKAIIEKSGGSSEFTYDRLESLLEEDFDVKDIGTNRIVFISKKKKYSDYVFKVATDDHGIEANYREFYNGDLDKRLTFSYSISKDGIFVVQERVKPFKSDMLDKYKDDIRDMLKHLSKKLLLVDCKVKNFKNFGLRGNGDVCLLDHGDTIPLPDYQGSEIVNADEESYVSLKCKGFKDPTSPKIKPCGGRLKYSKNFDYLECEKCGQRISVNDAYKEFYGDLRLAADQRAGSIEVSDEFRAWEANLPQKIQDYCIHTMDSVDNKEEKETENAEMTEKVINGEKCKQISGYWIPEKLQKGVYAMTFSSVRTGKMKPAELFKAANIDASDYRVMAGDHAAAEGEKKEKPVFTPNPNLKSWVDYDEFAEKVIGMAIKEMIKTNNSNPTIKFEDTGVNVSFTIAKETWIRIKASPKVRRARYDMKDMTFSIDLDLEQTKSAAKAPAAEVKPDVVPEAIKSVKNINTKQYLVNGVCCGISADYYLPVDIYEPNLDHDETKSRLKEEGYEPKKFKIVNAMGSAVEVNNNDHEEKFVSEEAESDNEQETSYVSDSEDGDSRRFADDDDDFGSGVNVINEDESEDSDDVEDYTRGSAKRETWRKSLEQYKENIDTASKVVNEISESGNRDSFRSAINGLINYDNDGVCLIPAEKVVETINSYVMANKIKPLTYDNAVVAATTVSQICEVETSAANKNDEHGIMIEVIDGEFQRVCRTYNSMKNLAEESDGDFNTNSCMHDTVMPENFNEELTEYTKLEYMKVRDIEEFLDLLYERFDEDMDADSISREVYGKMSDTVDALLDMRTVYYSAIHKAFKDYGLDNYIPSRNLDKVNGRTKFDADDFCYTMTTCCAGTMLEELESRIGTINPDEVRELAKFLDMDTEFLDEIFVYFGGTKETVSIDSFAKQVADVAGKLPEVTDGTDVAKKKEMLMRYIEELENLLDVAKKLLNSFN